MKFTPELYPFLTQQELDSSIVLRDGMALLEADDVMEIIQYSICENQKDSFMQ